MSTKWGDYHYEVMERVMRRKRRTQKEGGGVPIFVYVIFITLFILFNCFAINQWLQYRGKGKWADYLYGERVYLILSLVAKSALAWQVFGGTLSG